MPVILCLAEMQQGSLLQDFVKKKDCGPSGWMLPVYVESVQGSAKQYQTHVLLTNGWENQLLSQLPVRKSEKMP